MFRSALLLNIYSSEQTTAYPVFGECLIMYILYEIMREAGLRLPQSIGHAVSIVGGLVIGEISVSAGLMSAPVVLIIRQLYDTEAGIYSRRRYVWLVRNYSRRCCYIFQNVFKKHIRSAVYRTVCACDAEKHYP